MRLLLAEDDRMIGASIGRGLKQDGFTVDWVDDGRAAELALRENVHDLLLLDLSLPRRDGLAVLTAMRQRGDTRPVLILTARDAIADRVAGLDAGADDYVAKPFALAELTARLRALLRRGAPRESVLKVADLEMDTIKRLVRRAGRLVDLKPKEYALLEFLMRHSDRPLTKSLIIEHVWDIHFDSISNVVEVHINSLRNKVDRGFTPPLIHTIRGVGYVLTDSPS